MTSTRLAALGLVAACSGSAGGSAVDASERDGGAGIDADPAAPDAAPPEYVRLPCDVTVGGGGTLTIDDTVGTAGQVVCISAGTYTGGSITDVHDRVLQNDGGVVTITGIVTLSGLDGVTISGSGVDGTTYGWLLSGAFGSFDIKGHNQGLLVHHLEAIAAGSANLPLFEAGHAGTVWSGDPSGFALYQSRFDYLHLSGSGALLQGNYGSVTSFENYFSDLEIAHVIVEDSQGTGDIVVGGSGIFHLQAHDWTITGPNDVVEGSADDRDTGVIMFSGTGTVERLHRDGGWGWLVRNFGVELGPDRGEFRCEHNVDLNTEYYGTCETRSDITPDQFQDGVLSTIDMFVSNNLSANKLDLKGAYTTAIALIANLKVDTTVTLLDNVGCNNVNDYGDVDSLHFFGTFGTVIQSGNMALATCAGVVDPITGESLAP